MYEIREMVGSEKGKYTPIEVQVGRVTDLGGFSWASVGGRERVLLPLRHPDLAAQTASAVAPLKELVSGEPINWRPTTPPPIHTVPVASTNLGLVADLLMIYSEEVNKPPLRTQLREARSLEAFTRLFIPASPPLLGEPGYGDDGALFIGSNYGQLRKRDRDGTWKPIDTGTISPITAISVNGNQLLAGTYDGLLLSSVDGGQTWTRLHRFDGEQVVLGIIRSGNQYVVHTGTVVAHPSVKRTDVASMRVYLNGSASQGQPKLLRQIDFPERISGYLLFSLNSIQAGKYYFLNTYGSIERLDLSTLTWTKMPLMHEVSYLRLSSNGQMLTAFKAQGIFSKLSVSMDLGEHWASMEKPSYQVNDIHMESPTAGSATRWDTGAFSSSLEWNEYDPASDSWKKTWSAPPSTCSRTIRDSSGRQLICVSYGGSIFRVGSGKLVPEFLAD
jgi:hypothetical protein